jgi:hypothetical protein
MVYVDCPAELGEHKCMVVLPSEAPVHMGGHVCPCGVTWQDSVTLRDWERILPKRFER